MNSSKIKTKDNLKDLLEVPEVVTWRTLMEVFKDLYQGFEEALQSDGFSYSRFQFMFFLYFEESHSPIELSKKLGVTRSNISTFIRRMKKDGIIIECPHSSSTKRPCYRLSQKGIALFEEIFPKHIERVTKQIRAQPKRNLAFLKKVKQ